MDANNASSESLHGLRHGTDADTACVSYLSHLREFIQRINAYDNSLNMFHFAFTTMKQLSTCVRCF
jgi:hypothetical protein